MGNQYEVYLGKVDHTQPIFSVSPEPEFYVKTREEDLDQFLVLACDGVWDVMSNDDICNFITHRMKVHDNLETICNEVIDTCLYKVCSITIGRIT